MRERESDSVGIDGNRISNQGDVHLGERFQVTTDITMKDATTVDTAAIEVNAAAYSASVVAEPVRIIRMSGTASRSCCSR